MGKDFSALLRYESTGDMSDDRIAAIELESPGDVKQVATLWRSQGFGPQQLNRAGWVTRTVFPEPAPKPKAPTTEYAFRTGEGFCLTFGEDAIWVYHPLRWHTFLSEGQWQETMVNACRALAAVLSASEGIVTRDESPIIEGFCSGMSFEKAIAQGRGLEGRVLAISDLYETLDDVGTWDSHGYCYFLGPET